MRLYVPSYIHTLGHAHNGVLYVCTVTKEEKTALRAKLPGCDLYFDGDDDDDNDGDNDDEDY